MSLNPLIDNKEEAEKLKIESLRENLADDPDEDHQDRDRKCMTPETIATWVEYLYPAFNELIAHGVLAFIYPFSRNIIGRNKIIDLFSTKEREGFLPYMYYRVIGDRSPEITLILNQYVDYPVDAINIVFKKYFGSKYYWNANNTITIVKQGKQRIYPQSHLAGIRCQLKRSKNKTKIIQLGKKNVEKYANSPQLNTILEYTGDTQNVIECLKESFEFKCIEVDNLPTYPLVKTFKFMVDKTKKYLIMNLSFTDEEWHAHMQKHGIYS
jgi:hypothetical protein